MVRALAGLVVALPPLAGADDAQAQSLQGVWEGTLGTQNIVACFNGDTTGSGSYYYLHYLKPIQLQREKDGTGWFESRYDSKAGKDVKTGSWSLQTMDNGRLKGEWKHPKRGRSLPLALTPISDEGDELPCASNSFNDRLETVQPVAIGKQEVFEGKPFRRLRAGGEETLELLVDGPGIAKINRVLRSKCNGPANTVLTNRTLALVWQEDLHCKADVIACRVSMLSDYRDGAYPRTSKRDLSRRN